MTHRRRAPAGELGRTAAWVRPLALGLVGSIGAASALALHPRTQVFGTFPFRGPAVGRTVALTFDDGPNEPWTTALLATLAQREVPATFFQVGRCAERHPDSTRRVVDGGHVLGNHSYSHSLHRYLTRPRQREEIVRAQEVLHRISGRVPALYRPPWLCHWPWVLSSVRRCGLQVVSGTFGSSWEILQPPASTMTDSAVARTEPGSILIFHDGREARGRPRGQTVAAIGPLIDRLSDLGYTFITVDRMLGVPAYG